MADDRKEIHVLPTLLIVLVVLWVLGVGTPHTLGGLIPVFLAVAIVVVVFRLLQRRRPLRD